MSTGRSLEEVRRPSLPGRGSRQEAGVHPQQSAGPPGRPAPAAGWAACECKRPRQAGPADPEPYSSLRRCQRGKRQGASHREGRPSLSLGVATPPAAHKHSSWTGTQASSSSHQLGQRPKVSVAQSLHVQSGGGLFAGAAHGGAWSPSSPEPREPARLRSPGLHRAGIRRRALLGAARRQSLTLLPGGPRGDTQPQASGDAKARNQMVVRA